MGYCTSRMCPTTNNLCTSSRMIVSSSLKYWRSCLIGWAVGKIYSLCFITLGSTPSRSLGVDAKISKFRVRQLINKVFNAAGRSWVIQVVRSEWAGIMPMTSISESGRDVDSTLNWIYCFRRLAQPFQLPSGSCSFLPCPNSIHIIFLSNLLVSSYFPHFLPYRKLDRLVIWRSESLQTTEDREAKNSTVGRGCVHHRKHSQKGLPPRLST